MTSLSEAYHGDARGRPALRRLYAGVGLFVVGALLLLVAIVITTTDVYVGGGVTMTDARHVGGVLGGLGLPAVFLGVFAVLPSGRVTRAAAVIGASIAILGVGLFWHAYPCGWVGSNCGAGVADLTLPTVGIYFVGAMTTFWCLFVGVANFKTRNDPGGTARVDVTTRGETKVVEVERNRGFSGLGFLGATPDGDVETQTGRQSTPSTEPPSTTQSPPARSRTTGATADGGASTQDIREVSRRPDEGAEVETTRQGPSRPDDAYCGNCQHFQYVRTDDGIQPHCGLHAELMDDMDACEQWTAKR
ncbi:MAG: ribonuclease BN [Haloferacaceae archaeon]